VNEPSPTLIGQVAEAKTNKEIMGRLVSAYMPFIKKCVSSVFSKKEIREEYTPEATLGFLQSVHTYQSESGAFIPYAKTVIRNRLLNAAAKEARREKWHIPFFSKKAASGNESAAEYSPLEIEAAQRGHELTVEQENLRQEIAEINREFSEWGFDVADLARHRPKQDRSRLTCQTIAWAVLGDSRLASEMKETRKLPVKKITALTGCSEKILEKYRRYIAALVLIMSGEYPYIQSFLPRKDEETQ
jgi:RNA polymerase sigma factor